MNLFKKISNQPFFIKLFNWEYWSFNVVYGPIYLVWFWFCIKARSFFFFNTSNPFIKNGGFLMESKKEIYDLMPQQFYPKTLFCKKGTSSVALINSIKEAEFTFPLIGKPDIGLRGMKVQKLENETDVANYLKESKVDFLVQDFIPYENEIGLFYYRYPNEKKGNISGIVGKEFLSVTGDGTSTIEQLLMLDKRFILQLDVLRKSHGEELKSMLAKNDKKVLVPYGNHCRGAKFIDISHLIDKQLTEAMDKVCQQIPGFYFGRMDIRYNTWEELCQGKNFSIIELNGAGSEPTHIYDPKHSIFFAWKEIIRHWNILYKISKLNHQSFKMPYMKFSLGMEMFKENSAYVKLIAES